MVKGSSADELYFTAYCCGVPMKMTRKDNRIHFECVTGGHGRWFTISEDSSQISTCSCYSGGGELLTADLGAVRLYSCKGCGARYSVFVDGIKLEAEVEGFNADDVAKVGRESISALWDRLYSHDSQYRIDALFRRNVNVFVDQVKGDAIVGRKTQGDIIDVSGDRSIGKAGRNAKIEVDKEIKESKWLRPIIIAVVGSVLAAIIIYLMNIYGILFTILP